MQDTFITPMTGRMPADYENADPKVSFVDEQKTNFLNKILRGEISAVDAYEQVIPTFKNERDRFLLSGIRNEHDRNVEKLKMLVEHAHFAPDEGAGPWGAIVAAIVGAAKLVSCTAALKALVEGEEHGLRLYKDALNYPLTEEEYGVIARDIMPSMKRHVVSLEKMIKDQDDAVINPDEP